MSDGNGCGAMIMVEKTKQDHFELDEQQGQQSLAEAQVRFDQLVGVLSDQPTDTGTHSALYKLCLNHPELTSVAYRRALDLVFHSGGDPCVRMLALEIGRLHYRQKRPSGAATLLDEQAIARDIEHRC